MTIALIPTRDEDQLHLAELIRQVKHYVSQVVILDDSEDSWGMYQVALATGSEYRHGFGSLGCALSQGLYSCVGLEANALVIDAGGSHDPHEIGRLLTAALPDRIVIGSRFVPRGVHEGPWWRAAGSILFGEAMTLRTGWPLQDWTSGFRLYGHKAISRICDYDWIRTCDGHAIQAELLELAIRNGLISAMEVPITYRRSDSAFSRSDVSEAWRYLRSPR